MLYALNLYSDVFQLFLSNTGEKRKVLYDSRFSSVNSDQNLYLCAYLKKFMFNSMSYISW